MSTDTELFAALIVEVNRIANSLEILTAAQVPSPNYKRGLNEYNRFDWQAIGARVLEKDAEGATRVEWNGRTYTRRNSDDRKKGAAIWFSAVVAGNVAEGNMKWGRLASFTSKTSEAEPLTEKLQQARVVATDRLASTRPAPGREVVEPSPVVPSTPTGVADADPNMTWPPSAYEALKSRKLTGDMDRLLGMSKILTHNAEASLFYDWAKAVAHAKQVEKQDTASAVFLADSAIQSAIRK